MLAKSPPTLCHTPPALKFVASASCAYSFPCSAARRYHFDRFSHHLSEHHNRRYGITHTEVRNCAWAIPYLGGELILVGSSTNPLGRLRVILRNALTALQTHPCRLTYCELGVSLFGGYGNTISPLPTCSPFDWLHHGARGKFPRFAFHAFALAATYPSHALISVLRRIIAGDFGGHFGDNIGGGPGGEVFGLANFGGEIFLADYHSAAGVVVVLADGKTERRTTRGAFHRAQGGRNGAGTQ